MQQREGVHLRSHCHGHTLCAIARPSVDIVLPEQMNRWDAPPSEALLHAHALPVDI